MCRGAEFSSSFAIGRLVAAVVVRRRRRRALFRRLYPPLTRVCAGGCSEPSSLPSCRDLFSPDPRRISGDEKRRVTHREVALRRPFKLNYFSVVVVKFSYL